MPNGFTEVPGWFSANNDGGGAAVADLGGTGVQDLLVLLVDSPGGQNRGLYRVGKNLDAQGTPTGGWGDWLEIPNWFSHNNQGAGIAVADVTGDGHPDLIVFMIDNPAGQNRGIYQIGKNLDGDGRVTGGWTGWQDVPGWFSWENDGGAIAAADLDGDGSLELIVFMIDAPVGPNAGLYKIGKGLDGSGNITGGWTDWLPVPDWFSDRNQGAGVAITSLANDGSRDAVFFQIDNAITQNQAFFKVAHGIAVDGVVGGAWSPWHGVPGWFSWENQGGSIAIAPLQGPNTHDLVAFGIDHPFGQNTGFYRVVAMDNNPAVHGTWELVRYDSEVLAVHAAVLPHGKVLFFAGSGNNGVRFASPDFGNTKLGFWCSVVWNYASSAATGQPMFSHPETLRDTNGRPVDFFCGGESLLPDGNLLAAGGTLLYDVDGHNQPSGHGFAGRRDALIFDLASEQWKVTTSMAHGRWYPTLITLGDGTILAASGKDEKEGINHDLEVYSLASGGWQNIATLFTLPLMDLPLYAHLFQLVDGRVFFTGGRMDDASLLSPSLIDITQNPVRVDSISGLSASLSRNQSASVILPPAQDQKFMIMGGALPIGEDYATDSVDIIDLKDLSRPLPSYQAAASLLLPRVHLNAILLPDRTVFVCGGALDREGGKERRILARYQSEIYDPAANAWRLAATSQVARMYHSIALLLEDGRVVAASGNPDKGTQVPWLPPDPNEELRIEVYSPPYLFQGPRPSITTAPDTCTYGETFVIESPDSVGIQWASLIRNGVTTHSFNTTQRLVDLEIRVQDAVHLEVVVPTQPNLAPPGFYMLFLLNKAGVPSVAHWIQLK